MARSYYQILGVKASATVEDIKSAYRKKALKFHPDTGKSKDASRFHELSEAYQTLSDPQRRLQYDTQHQAAKPTKRSRPSKNTMPIDVHVDLYISAQERAFGGQRQLQQRTQKGMQTVNIRIPAGLTPGQKLRAKGLGLVGGDLILHIW